MSIFGERIKKLRNERGITQKQAADDLKISPQTLSYYENGREASYDILIKMSKYYGVSVDYLLGIIDKYFYSETENINRLGLSDKAINTLVKLNSDESEKAAAEFLNELILQVDFSNIVKSNATIKAAAEVISYILSSPNFENAVKGIAQKKNREHLEKILYNESLMHGKDMSILEFLQKEKQIKKEHKSIIDNIFSPLGVIGIDKSLRQLYVELINKYISD